jgi:hypothetical protein
MVRTTTTTTNAATKTNTQNTSASKVMTPILDTDSLKERLIITGGQSVVLARGSLTKCVSRFKDFADLALTTKPATGTNDEQNEDCIDDESIAASTEAKLKKIRNELIIELKLHDLEMKKIVYGAKASEQELSHYDNITRHTQHSINECRQEIESLKLKLTHEQTVRTNREQYEAVAKLSKNTQPIRLTKRKLKEIESEMESIRSRDAVVQEQLIRRKRQFHSLMKNIYDLKADLMEDTLRDEELQNINSEETS